MRRKYLVPALAAALSLSAGVLGAPSETDTADPSDRPPDPPIDSDDERPVPNYDGREEPTTAGDVLIWVPRILLSPLYLVSEYVVRRPLGAVITWAEEKHLPEKVVDALTFGKDRQGGIVPTGVIDFGFRPSVGVYFFYNDWIPNNDLRIRAATGLSDLEWLRLTMRNRLNIGFEERFTIGGDFLKRPDFAFHGFGPRSDDTRYRFSTTAWQADVGYEKRLWRRSNFETFIGVRKATFDAATSCCGDDSVATAIRLGELSEPPGIADGYSVLRTGIDVDFDTRHLREPVINVPHSDFKAPAGSGVRLDLRGEYDASIGRSRPFALAPRDRYEFIKYGATLTSYWDITGEQRVASLSAIVDFADPLRDGGVIPFTEQVMLGGERPLRGFLAGRFVDRSSIVGRFAYSWPIWPWIDGFLGYEMGNVFGEHLSGFELEQLRSSYGMGIRSNASEDHVFEMLLAFGTETIEDGMGIEHIRFVLGATSGF